MNNINKKDDAYKVLETINTWINNSDTKASIILGIIGVFFSIFFSNESILLKFYELGEVVIKDIKFCDFMYFMFVLYSCLNIIFGLYKLFKVLIPTLKLDMKEENSSLIYFGSIAKFNSKKEFIEKSMNATDKEIIDDILTQIYNNSIICNKKFNNFKDGFRKTCIGIISLIFLYVVGILIYL